MWTKFSVLAIAAAILASSQSAYAQQQTPEKIWRIGYLSAATAGRDKLMLAEFRKGLRQLGYRVGKNIIIEERYAAGRYKRLPRLAAELLDLKVDVLMAAGPAAGYAKKSTTTVPVVIRTADPVGKGLVKSLTHPGGNVTGLSTFSATLVGKRLELLKEAVPTASRVAILWFPRPGSSHFKQMETLEAVAPKLGVMLLPVAIKGAKDLERVFSVTLEKKPDALLVLAAGIFEARRKDIIDFTVKNKLPVVFAYDHWARDGGMMSYGTHVPALYQRMAAYVDKLLKGAKPAELPIEQPSKFKLVINLRTTNAFGIEMPRSLLLLADEVIR